MNLVFFKALGIFCVSLNCISSTYSEATTCTKNGNDYPVGPFPNPNNPCSLCYCAETGEVSCVKKPCPKLACGEDLKEKLNSSDCCETCSRICNATVQPALDCPLNRQFYQPLSCKAECGCLYQKKLVPVGLLTVGERCDNCTCMRHKLKSKDLKVVCNRLKCPAVKLECVDATYDAYCNYICPQGKTCNVGKHVIKYGEFKRVGKGNKVCTCVGDGWYPRASCFNRMKKVPDDYKKLQKTRCMADPTTYSEWKAIYALFAAPEKPPLL